MEKIALIATDLDGTLLRSDEALAPEGVFWLQQAARRGIWVVFATGRNPYMVQQVCQEVGLHDPMICTNGAQVWGSPDGPVWASYVIPQAVALAIAHVADANDWGLSTTIGNKTFRRKRTGEEAGPISPNKTLVATNTEVITADALRILTSKYEAITTLYALCQEQFTEHCYAEMYYRPDDSVRSLGIFPRNARKGKGLALVCDRLGIPREQVMAIGDDVNDLSLFAQAGIRVAMGNARQIIKQRATLIAPTNNDEGVAWALKSILKEGI